VEVPADLRRDLVIGQGRPLRCFEEALRYVMAHADHDVRLVHGFVVEDDRPWPHGWAEISSRVVYCPTVGLFFDRNSYYQVLRAAPLVVYTPRRRPTMPPRRAASGRGLTATTPTSRSSPACSLVSHQPPNRHCCIWRSAPSTPSTWRLERLTIHDRPL
jgi:hypothetical protein